MDRKGILILGNYPPPFGGVPRHIEYLALFLSHKGWDVHILSSGNSGIERKNGITIHKIDKKNKVIILIKNLIASKKTKYLRFNRLLRNNPRMWLRYITNIAISEEIIQKNDINIISAYNLYAYAPIGAVLSEEYGIPLVTTNFGEIYEIRKWFIENIDLVRYVITVSKRLLAMSHHCARSYQLLGLCPDVQVIPYGADTKKFFPENDGSYIKQKFHISHDDKVVLFVGRMIRNMGLDVVLESIPSVLERNQRIKFIIVGERGELSDPAADLANSYKDRIFVEPIVPFDELPFYYAAADILIAPTQGERACGSLAAIEAMATGKAVIAAKIGGIPEIVKDRETGLLIPPNDYSALTKAILELAKNDELLAKMGVFGKERMVQFFNENILDQKIEEIFCKVLEL